VKAVNLIPKDGRRSSGVNVGLGFSPSYAVVGALIVALVFVVIYVLTSNTISDRKAKLATVQAQLRAEQALDTQLSKYVQFEKLAQTRVQTVREIAAARFNWYQALTDLSKVIPANTALQALTGSVVPGASAGGTGGGSASGLRSDLAGPAFELNGCTTSQDDVARLMSRLRLINGVTRVTLGSSQKTASTAAPGSASATGGCGANGPSFDLVVFFQPVAGAGPQGVTSVAATPAGTTAGASSSTPASTTSGTGAGG
jgi:Tfp pilus assembly protein PilN